METVSKRSNNLVLASASTTCLVQFAYPIVQYMGYSSNLRAVCIGASKQIAQKAIIVRVLPYLPFDCSSNQAQTKIISILKNRPRMTPLDISKHVLNDIVVSFSWILYKKFPRLESLLTIGGRNAIITTDDITDFYASFKPTSFLPKETVIEILLVSIPQEDYSTLQNFCDNPTSYERLCLIATDAYAYVCMYMEEAEDRRTVEYCFHVKDGQSREYFNLTLVKNNSMWTVLEVKSFHGRNFCEKCWI